MVRDHRSASSIRNHRREPQEAVWGGLLCVSRRPYPHFLLRQWRHRPTRGRPRGAPAPGAQAIREPIMICQVIRPAGGAGRPPKGPRARSSKMCPIPTCGSRCEGRVAPGGCPHHTPHAPSTRRLAFARFRRMRTAEAARVPAVLSHGCAGRRQAPSACATVRGAYRPPDRWGLWHVSAAIAVSGWHAKR